MFARAFAEDPLYVWTFPDERARTSRLPRLFATQLRAALRGREETDLMAAGEQSNVRYYESLGFAVTGQAELPGGGPAQWTMWRKPRQ